jgi:hypothetical protein
MPKKNVFYYRIYDDTEDKNYFKTNLNHKQVEEQIKLYEKRHKKFVNSTFVKFLQRTDSGAELITISDISY